MWLKMESQESGCAGGRRGKLKYSVPEYDGRGRSGGLVRAKSPVGDIARIWVAGMFRGSGVSVIGSSGVGLRVRERCQTLRCADGSARATRVESPIHVARSRVSGSIIYTYL